MKARKHKQDQNCSWSRLLLYENMTHPQAHNVTDTGQLPGGMAEAPLPYSHLPAAGQSSRWWPREHSEALHTGFWHALRELSSKLLHTATVPFQERLSLS